MRTDLENIDGRLQVPAAPPLSPAPSPTGRLSLTGRARVACPGLRRLPAGPVSRANGRRSRLGETDRMHCSHGNLDAVAASGTPNPRKVATSNTPAVCAVNEPADQWRQSAWPTYAGRASSRPSPPLPLESKSGSVRQRIAAATHHGGDEIAAQPRPRYFKMAPPALIRRNQRTSSDPWLAEQPVMHGRRSVLASESRAYRRVFAHAWGVSAGGPAPQTSQR